MSAPESKTCTNCETAKPLSEYYFEKGKPRSKCKECHRAKAYEVRADREAFNAKRRAYYVENSERILEAHRAWWAAHRDQLSDIRRERWANNREQISAQRRARYEAEPEKYLDRNRRYHEANREQVLAQRRASWHANKEEMNARQLAYREANKTSIAERNRAYYLANKDKWSPDKRRAWYEMGRKRYLAYQAYRYRLMNDPEACSVSREELWERDGGVCGICREPIDGNYHVDHIVPLALGGAHAYYNLQIAHPACNQSKNARLDGQVALPV